MIQPLAEIMEERKSLPTRGIKEINLAEIMEERKKERHFPVVE